MESATQYGRAIFLDESEPKRHAIELEARCMECQSHFIVYDTGDIVGYSTESGCDSCEKVVELLLAELFEEY